MPPRHVRATITVPVPDPDDDNDRPPRRRRKKRDELAPGPVLIRRGIVFFIAFVATCGGLFQVGVREPALEIIAFFASGILVILLKPYI